MPRVLLVGLMASGKSSVARAISAETGWAALDNDVLLERATGRTAAALLAEQGLEQLRAAEAAVVAEVLALPPPWVAGVAAGVVLDARDRERLRAGGHVVWLRADPAVLVHRLNAGSHRPWLEGDQAATLLAMAAERDPLFAEVAHQVVDVGTLSPEQAAAEVLRVVRG